MAAMTEAACLLKNGAAFARRAGLAAADGSLIFAGTKPGAFALYFEDEPYFHLDLDGRWQRAYVRGTHYLKALDGSVDAIDRVRDGGQMVLRRRRLSFAEVADLDAAVRTAALDLIERLDESRLVWHAPPEGVALDEPSLHDLLDRVAARDATAWFRDREAFTAAYGPGPLPFAPPSCSPPILLRATVSDDPPGQWVFGPTPATVRAPDEFAAHARAVSTFLGRRVAQARGLVLAGGDALRSPVDVVAGWLETATSVFPLTDAARRPAITARPEADPMLDGVYTFLDTPSTVLTEPDYRELAGRGLRHVDLGVVSGSPDVRRLHGATWRDDELEEQVGRLHAADISVGLVVPVGSGGQQHAEAHVDRTARMLGGLPIVAGDIVYLVDLAELAGVEASREALASRGVGPLDDAGRAAQLAALREALQPLRNERKVKVVPYTLEKQ
jgi:hypothetical protein